MPKLPTMPRLAKPASLPASHRNKARPREASPSSRPSPMTDHSYNPDTSCMTVTFRDGSQYRYTNIDPDKARAFQDADSKGSFLHTNIRGQHDCTKINP